MLSRQKGISLLEVLVGFVIFTSSLVAVLDFVSGYVYRNHLSSMNQQKVQMVYDLSVISDLGIEFQSNQVADYIDFDWTVTSVPMDSLKERETEQTLNRTTYSIINTNNTFEWTVLKINEVN